MESYVSNSCRTQVHSNPCDPAAPFLAHKVRVSLSHQTARVDSTARAAELTKSASSGKSCANRAFGRYRITPLIRSSVTNTFDVDSAFYPPHQDADPARAAPFQVISNGRRFNASDGCDATGRANSVQCFGDGPSDCSSSRNCSLRRACGRRRDCSGSHRTVRRVAVTSDR